ncbi:MAG: 50S ribosomal protein L24 [Anaerolineales bacterium]|nr:50S ribosomal protein L24 [Anaerolineales bacterium]
MRVKIVKGDTVEVISGNDKGHRGEVQRVIRRKNEDGTYDPDRVYVIVAGANLVIRHQRPTGRVGTQTGRIEKEAPIHISNVMLVGPGGKPTRVTYQVDRDGLKERVERKGAQALPKPKK